MRRPNGWLRLTLDGEGAPRGDHCAWRLGDGPVETGSLEEARGRLGPTVGVVVPGQEVLVTRVSVPGARGRQLRQAVPYALEERLAADVETLHFALGRTGPDGVTPVAVVARRAMQGWLERLAEAGLRAERMVPDSLALPAVEGGWHLLSEPEGAVLRPGPERGLTVEPAELPVVLARLREEAGDDAPATLEVHDCGGGTAAGELADEDGPEVRVHGCAAGALAVLAPDAAPFDLLQGEFDQREQRVRRWRQWRPAAALLAGVLVLQTALAVDEYRRLNAEREALDAAVEAVFREAFPEAQRVVNPRAQMEHRLQALRSGGGARGVLDLLAPTGAVLRDVNGLRLRGLRYRDEELELDVTLPDLQVLDGIRQALTGRGLAAEVGTASAEGGQVKARLRVGRGGEG